MKYTDLSKQNKIYNESPKGKAKLLLLFIVIGILGITLFFFRDNVIQAFNPISMVGGSTKLNINQTDGRTNILLLGSDKRSTGSESGRNSLTDTILIASIGNVDNDVVLISLPRDLWIPNYTLENGYSYSSKINEVYTNAGMSELEKQMEVILGIPIHYHLMVTFDLFENIIDIIGGIDINVEKSFTDYAYPVEGRENDMCGKSQEETDEIINKAKEEGTNLENVAFKNFSCRYETLKFTEGLQKMDGKTALKYARSRHGDNGEGTDFARSKRQQNVITAIKNKALSLETLLNPVKIKELYEQYATNVETNIDLQSIQSFYSLSQKMDFNKIISIVIDDRSEANEGGLLYHPSDSTLYGGQWVLVPQTGDFYQIHAYVQKYLFGDK